MARQFSEQERFWAGTFGSEYMRRNPDTSEAVARRLGFWAKILASMTGDIGTVLEFGANLGINCDALRLLLPASRLSAVEINADAAAVLRAKNLAEVYHQSFLDFTEDRRYDLVFTSGVLIHINPGLLPAAYDVMARASARYVVMAEYYNPTPVEVVYRGNKGRLFKRDFAGEFLARHPAFTLRDYGFVYHKDPRFPTDDATWFCMERKEGGV